MVSHLPATVIPFARSGRARGSGNAQSRHEADVVHGPRLTQGQRLELLGTVQTHAPGAESVAVVQARLRHKAKWLEQAQALHEGLSVHQAAERLQVAPSTAFRWRHRFLTLPRDVKAASLHGVAEADETCFLRSFKGQRVTKRASRHRGGKAAPCCQAMPSCAPTAAACWQRWPSSSASNITHSMRRLACVSRVSVLPWHLDAAGAGVEDGVHQELRWTPWKTSGESHAGRIVQS